MKPTFSDLANYINRLPTATYIVKDGIACAFPEYDIINNNNKPLAESDYPALLNSICQNINRICQNISIFIIIFYTNKLVVNEEIDNMITNIRQNISDISLEITDKLKITDNFKDRFNKIIIIFNKILTYYNDIKYNNIKITNDILLEFNNLNRELLSLYDKIIL
jgi:hypothetical protein